MNYMNSPPGATTTINGVQCDYYAGTSYYGLHGHPEIIKAVQESVRTHGIGTATGRAGYGNTHLIEKLEKTASQFFDTESAISFVSGYLGNLIHMQGLQSKFHKIFVDEKSHYSVKDAANVVNKPIIPFQNCDVKDLKTKIQENLDRNEVPLIISDGVFPMGGNIPPLLEYLEILDTLGKGYICLDDAHAVGTIGPNGRGTLDYFNLKPSECEVYSSQTLSKAVGSHGGIITNSEEFVSSLRENVHLLRGASDTPLPIIAASIKGLEILREHPEMRENLWKNTLYAKEKFMELGFQVNQNQVPIIKLEYPQTIDWKEMERYLLSKHIAIYNIGKGGYAGASGGMGRICINGSHSKAQIDRLIEETGKFLKTN